MQPTCRHVPPRKGSFSTTTVFNPSSPARIAATYPPGPLPIIATSYFATRSLPSAGARTDELSNLSPQSHSKKTRGGQADKTGHRPFVLRTASQTEKKPPALTAQTAASSKHRILTAARPPRNLVPDAVEACFLLRRDAAARPRRRRCGEHLRFPLRRSRRQLFSSTTYIRTIRIKNYLAFVVT